MRITIIILFFALMPVIAFAQTNPVERVYQKYAGMEGVTSLHISSGMFRLLAKIDPSDKDLSDLASSVNSILILHAPALHVNAAGMNFYDEVLQDLMVERYQELMKVNSSDQQVLFLADEVNGKIRELLMLVGGDGDNALICIRGDLDLKQLSSLSGIDAPGMGHFMSLEK